MNFKSLLLVFVVFIFSGCFVNTFHLNKKDKEINLSFDDKIIKIKLSKPLYENTYSQCSQDTYKLNDDNHVYGKLYIENIELDNSCSWNGLASGYFAYELKNRLKFKSFKLVNKFTKFNYEISTYLVNNEKYIDIIEIFSVNKNIFILDNMGKLSSYIISKLDKKYEYKYLNRQRTDIKYSFSLVDNNTFLNYFGKEVEFEGK